MWKVNPAEVKEILTFQFQMGRRQVVPLKRDGWDRRFIALLTALILLAGCQRMARSPSGPPLEALWATDLVNAGQIVAVLQHTEIGKEFAINSKFDGLTAHENLRGSIASKKADILLLAAQQTIELLAVDTTWTIIARVAPELAGLTVLMDSSTNQLRLSLLLTKKELLREHPETAIHLLMAFLEADLYCARHPDSTSKWYQSDIAGEHDAEMIKRYAALDPNRRAMMKGHISLNLPFRDLATLQETVENSANAARIQRPFEIASRVNLTYLRRAEEKWWKLPEIE